VGFSWSRERPTSSSSCLRSYCEKSVCCYVLARVVVIRGTYAEVRLAVVLRLVVVVVRHGVQLSVAGTLGVGGQGMQRSQCKEMGIRKQEGKAGVDKKAWIQLVLAG
jgi:hypothetical protein